MGFLFFYDFQYIDPHVTDNVLFFILELHATLFSVSAKHTGVTGRDFRLPHAGVIKAFALLKY